METQIPRSTLAEQRRRQIEQGLYDMLVTIPFQELRICDLCENLGITRKVFYKHYQDKEDCLCALMEDVMRKSLVYTVRNIPGWGLSLEAAQVILAYWKENRSLLDIVARDHLLELFVSLALEIALEEKDYLQEMLSCPEMPCDRDILNCYLGCHFAMILQWHARSFDTPVEEMARKYLRLVQLPLFYQGNT